METTIVYWGYIGMMENTMETIHYLGRIAQLEHKCLNFPEGPCSQSLGPFKRGYIGYWV